MTDTGSSAGAGLPRRRPGRNALLVTVAVLLAAGLVEAGILGVLFARGGWDLLWRARAEAPAAPAQGRPGPAPDGAVVFLADDVQRMRTRIERMFEDVVPPPVSLGAGEAAFWNRVRALQAQVDHVFKDAFLHPAPFGWSADLEGRLERSSVFPGMDMADEGTNYLVTVCLPGAGKDDISIGLDGRLLTISVSTRREARLFEDGAAARGRQTGQFHTRIMLPGPVRDDGVEASLAGGTLSIRIPKADVLASGRKIVVN